MCGCNLVALRLIGGERLWLFVTGLFFESETKIWYVVSGGWLIGLGGDRLWRDFVAPFLGFEEG
jgi:hypothetical protein